MKIYFIMKPRRCRCLFLFCIFLCVVWTSLKTFIDIINTKYDIPPSKRNEAISLAKSNHVQTIREYFMQRKIHLKRKSNENASNVTKRESNPIIITMSRSSSEEETEEEEISDQILPTMHLDRLGVVSYLPSSETEFLLQFITMLYGSWKMINENRAKLVSYKNLTQSVRIDLLTFCHSSICSFLPKDCKRLSTSTAIAATRMPSCFFVREDNVVDFDYPVLNSLIMFKRFDIYQLTKSYRYLLRTDVDIFLGPALLHTRPTKYINVGYGAYCETFNEERLKKVSMKLKMIHRGVHCVGSTWLGKTKILIHLANQTLSLTKYMYLNEFSSNLIGLEDIDFEGSQKHGIWKRWWKPVTLLYAAELVLNNVFPDFSDNYKMNLDMNSCSKETILKQVHIHCYHSNCEFHKFNFTDNLKAVLSSSAKIDTSVARNLIKYAKVLDFTKMDVTEYASYVAWSSVHKYMFLNTFK